MSTIKVKFVTLKKIYMSSEYNFYSILRANCAIGIKDHIYLIYGDFTDN